MILKNFELNKQKIKDKKIFLLYGNNKGLIDETIKEKLKPILPKNIQLYEESEILRDKENFIENSLNKSFFESEKLIIISRISEKILGTISEIVEKNLPDLSIILTSVALEKKSKIRIFFEKSVNTICVPFYEDNNQSLVLVAQKFLRERKISLSQENLNLIIERSSGDRVNLFNELEKISSLLLSKKNIKTAEILKLTNLAENYSASELVDTSLTKNKKKTLNILNENNFAQEDCIIIIRILLAKLKRLSKLHEDMNKNDNIEKTISSFKPPIFWKDKENVKKQLRIWDYDKIQKLIVRTNDIELMIKKNPSISILFLIDYILEISV